MKRTFKLFSLAIIVSLLVSAARLSLIPARAAGTWEYVGPAGFSGIAASHPSLALNSGIPYVAFGDYVHGDKASVMKFDGTDWVYVGQAGFSAVSASYTSLAFDNGTPYVAYVDAEGPFQKVNVMKFDALSGNWAYVGPANFSPVEATYLSLAFDHGTPYVAYVDGESLFHKANVMKFDAISGNWVYVGPANFSAGDSIGLSLVFNSGIPYVATNVYSDQVEGFKANVMKFDAPSGNWMNVGPANFSRGMVGNLSLAFDSGTPYVAFSDVAYDYKASLMKFDVLSGEWVYVGPAGFSNKAQHVSLVFDSGTPYVAFQDEASSYQISVMKFTGDSSGPSAIRYVKWNASGANNGTSWANAYKDLQSALAAASYGDEIWTAAGTYKPTSNTDRTISFMLKSGVSIYGGFAGTETSLIQRDPATNVTILSGDIGIIGDSSDNSFNVVTTSGVDSTTTLDGLTITAGNANDSIVDQGGGISNWEGHPSLLNLIIRNNHANHNGGGMYSQKSNPSLVNVTFKDNTSGNNGAGMFNEFGIPSLTKVTFSNNSAHYYGGGMSNFGSSPILTNVTFMGNSAGYSGGGMSNVGESKPILTNVTFSRNSANLLGGGAIYNFAGELYVGGSVPKIVNSILYNNTGGEIFNDGTLTRPDIRYSIVQGGYPGIGNLSSDPLLGALANHGGFTQTMALGVGSPAIDAGYDSNCPNDDQRGVTRPQGSHCDIGAYEVALDATPPTVTSIVRASDNPTSAASVTFNVTFSEAVTGVAISDFILYTTGTVAGASIQNVSGSDALFTVTVNTGAGYGNLRLDVPATATIHDLAGNSLGSLPFVTGETYSLARNNGADTTGVFRPSNGLLYLKNQNTTGFADVAINYGIGGDYPVVGDWDGNGDATIGVYRGGKFYLRNTNTIGFADLVFAFGQIGDQPIAGDWDGDGVDTIGVYRPSNGQFLLRNSNTAGIAEMTFYLGNVGDVGIAGDWDGDGKDTTGVFRPINGIIFLKNINETGYADVALNYGIPGDKPVTGDWNNDGIDTIGVYRNGQFLLRNSNTIGFADIAFGLGNPGDMPIAGNWDGIP